MVKQYGLQIQPSRDVKESTQVVNPLIDSTTQKSEYIVGNEGPALAEHVSSELATLFNEFMEVDNSDES
jgi:hypothetical protein